MRRRSGSLDGGPLGDPGPADGQPPTTATAGQGSVVTVVRLLRLSPVRLAGAAVLGSLTVLAATALLGASAWLIVKAAEQPPVAALALAAVLVRALGISRAVFRYAERLLSHGVALSGVVELRARVYDRLVDADDAAVSGLRRGDLLARLGADLDTLGDVVVRSVLPALSATVTASVAVVAVAVIHPPAAVALLLGLVVSGLAAPALAAVAAVRREREAARATAEISSATLATLEATPELRVAGLAPRQLARLSRLDGALAAARGGADRAAGWAAATSTAGLAVALVGTALVTVPAMASGAVTPTLGAVALFVPLAAVEATTGLPPAAALWVRARTAAGRVLALVEPAAGRHPVGRAHGSATPSVRAPAPAVPAHRCAVLDARGVAAGWPGRPDAVAAVDLVVDGGTRSVAIVGPSGSGKSTLLATLAGLLPPRAGEVRVAGEDPGGVSDERRRGLVHLLSEADHVFATTVRENLRLADPAADDRRLVAVLVDAGLGAWLSGLPAGLDTRLGADGADVSGGERRRLLLARALLSPAALLLVDEPAEHLDPETADLLVRELLTGDRPVVVAGHRLSPLSVADEVLVVSAGAVVDRGTLHELVARRADLAQALAAEQAASPGRVHPPGTGQPTPPGSPACGDVDPAGRVTTTATGTTTSAVSHRVSTTPT